MFDSNHLVRPLLWCANWAHL